ncbi:MAG: phosphoribosylanthranilate isomerase [bacterium]
MLLKTDMDFAQASIEKGTPEAFYLYLTDDALQLPQKSSTRKCIKAVVKTVTAFPIISENRQIKNIIQVAGIKDEKEAQMLSASGVDWLGFPLRLTRHQADLSEDEAAKIIHALKLPHFGVLITYLRKAEKIIALCRKLGTTKVQLHGKIKVSELRKLQTLSPELFVIRSLIVQHNNMEELTATMRQCSPYVSAFITDTYDPATETCGATGKTHNWQISRQLVESSSRPIILAGGLNPDNVRRAILEVKPAGVDAHTGLEGTDGRKQIQLVRAFVNEARVAFAQVSSQAL